MTHWLRELRDAVPTRNPKLPSSFSLTFTTPGRYEYWCLIHADVGQRGIVVVR